MLNNIAHSIAKRASLLNNGGVGILGKIADSFQTQLTSLYGFSRDIQTSSLAFQQQSSEVKPESGSTFPPWTPTAELSKRKKYTKRMGHLLSVLESEREAEAVQTKKFPDFKSGDVLELKLAIPENKRRTTTFKGICIAKFNKGYRTSFTLRNFIGSTGGIERTFPLYSPHLLDLKVLQNAHKKYRRSKLYMLRDRQPKEYRV